MLFQNPLEIQGQLLEGLQEERGPGGEEGEGAWRRKGVNMHIPCVERTGFWLWLLSLSVPPVRHPGRRGVVSRYSHCSEEPRRGPTSGFLHPPAPCKTKVTWVRGLPRGLIWGQHPEPVLRPGPGSASDFLPRFPRSSQIRRCRRGSVDPPRAPAQHPLFLPAGFM